MVSEKDSVIDLRLDNLEQTAARHERLIEQLVQSNMDMKTGLTKVATELEVTNGLIASYMSNTQKITFALIAIVAGAMGLSTQM
jgi:plasmid maintenance system antidote protein VapI